MNRPARLVVLVSGSGTNLQALLDACADPAYGARVVAVGSDRDGIEGLARAERAGVPTFTRSVSDFETREGWDASLTTVVERFEPDVVVSAGFMKLLPLEFLERFLTLNTHPALCPAFPGMHGPRDALEHGVKVPGATLFVVDAGVDTGPIVAQVPVEALGEAGEVLDLGHGDPEALDQGGRAPGGDQGHARVGQPPDQVLEPGLVVDRHERSLDGDLVIHVRFGPFCP